MTRESVVFNLLNSTVGLPNVPECSCSKNHSCFLFPRSKNLPYLIYGIVAFMNIFFGIVSNILTIIVLSKRSMARQALVRFFMTLAAFDLSFVILSGTSDALLAICLFAKNQVVNSGAIVTRFSYPIAFFFRCGVVWLTIGIALQRYLAVKYPLWACDRVKEARREKQMICCIVVSCLAFSVPMFWTIGLSQCRDPDLNKTLTVLIKGPLADTGILANKAYIIWLHGMFVVIVPTIVLSVLSQLIYGTVQRSSRLRKKLTRSAKKSIKTNKMLLAVVACFLSCNLLTLVFDLLEIFGVSVPPRTAVHIAHASNFLILLNSSVNFFIYYHFSPTFRYTFLYYLRILLCGHVISVDLLGDTSLRRMSTTSTLRVGSVVSVDARNYRSSAQSPRIASVRHSRATAPRRQSSRVRTNSGECGKSLLEDPHIISVAPLTNGHSFVDHSLEVITYV